MKTPILTNAILLSTILLNAILLSAGLIAMNASAAENAAGGAPGRSAEDLAKTCAACHSADGNATADAQYPRLAGQYHDYIAQALREYKNGERKNAIMAGFAATLSERDIQALADYY
ncbi:MAG TPA: c-type cytochrome, partial [Rudaea sp.]